MHARACPERLFIPSYSTTKLKHVRACPERLFIPSVLAKSNIDRREYFVFMLASTIHGGRPRQLPTRAAQSGYRPEETSRRQCLPPCPHPQICKPHTNRPLAGTAPILRFFCCRLQLGSCSSSPQTHATSDSWEATHFPQYPNHFKALPLHCNSLNTNFSIGCSN
jgi:hypothetical protein